MADEGFRLPGSSYEELTRIIKAYGALNAESDLAEVSKIAAMHPTSISRNTGFLVSIDILTGGQKKQITEKGRALARALEHEMPDEITRYWRDLVAENDFMQKLLSAVRIRKGMEPSTLQSHVAYSAGQPRKGTVMTGASAVVEILRAASLLREEGGKLVSAADEESSRHDTALTGSTVSQPAGFSTEHHATLPVGIERTGGAAVTIQIQIQCSADEVEALGPRLRMLLDQLSRPAVSDRALVGE